MPTLQVQAGVLAPPACYATEQERAEAFAAIYTVEIPDTLAQWVTSESEPAIEDQDKLWARIDSVTGLVVQAYKFVDGNWQPWLSAIQFFTSTGSAGSPDNYIATFTPPNVQLVAGQVFIMEASFTNTGAAQVTVDSIVGGKPIRKEYNQPLAAGEIVAGQMVTMIYDGTNFQVTSQLTQISEHGRQIITTAGTADFTVPDNVKQITVTLVGAGGAGGGTGSANGGGGGGYATSILTVTPGQIIPYTVGAKGTKVIGGNGNPGGNTIFNTTIIANGGAGGTDAGLSAGGAYSGADFGINGNNSSTTFGSDSDKPSGGTSQFWMSRGGILVGGTEVQTPLYGGGGYGDTDPSGGHDGQDGADGLIIVEW